VPYEFYGDCRKREAKRHKSNTVVSVEEMELETLIREYQDSNPKIVELEHELEILKIKKISKKELQSERNRYTAQLSRDRQKLELSYLKAQCINYSKLVKKLDAKVKEMCVSCSNGLASTIKTHK
jgi:hypothetical protein